MSAVDLHPFHGCPHCLEHVGPDNVYNADTAKGSVA